MRAKRPSQTASFVGFLRAIAAAGFTSVPSFSDPVVASLLSPRWAAAVRAVTWRFERLERGRREQVIAQLDVIPMRVAAIDRELEKAVHAGAGQVVILGAGLDTRAFRLRSLADTTVYEVDHPATQAAKRQQTFLLRPLARSLVFVPVDFERDALATCLKAAGHRPDVPTAWVWEGVVMYLSDAALSSTLTGIARASAPGSKLIVHYHEPPVRRGRASRIKNAVLRLWGEPQIGERRREDIAERIRAGGFDVESDTGPEDWARALKANVPVGETARISRMVVAVRSVS
jgi:methyltransferase (TIGR00027 family)